MKNKSEGFSNSFYVKRPDVDFMLAVEVWCKMKELSLSNVIVSALKFYFLSPGDLFNDFKETFEKVIDQNLEDTFIIHRNEKIKLKDLIEREFVVNDTRNKL